MQSYSAESILLGALNHDIGKFVFRSGEKEKHQRSGETFFREHTHHLKALEPITEAICDIIRNHHDAANIPPSIKIADEISADERKNEESDETYRPLMDIFQFLDIDRAELQNQVYYHYPAAEDLSQVFPTQGPEVQSKEWKPDEAEVKTKHKLALDAFAKEMESIPGPMKLTGIIDTLYHLAAKWEWGVCSAGYKTRPDISLFDHQRMVAAIAMSHYLSNNEHKPFLFLMGDISGIQNFIYNIDSPSEGSPNMAKRLRGRSFYLQLLGEVFANYILDTMHLYPVHLIYNGGGHFLILLPNTEHHRTQLKEIEETLTNWIFNKYHGRLGIVIDAIETSPDELKDFSSLYTNIANKIHLKKSKKFFSLINKMIQPLETLRGENISICPVCRNEFKGSSICYDCNDHVEIGKEIIKSKYIIEIHLKNETIIRDYPKQITPIFFKEFKLAYFLSRKSEDVVALIKSFPEDQIEKVLIKRINNSDFLQSELLNLVKLKLFPIGFGYTWIANHAPLEKNNKVMEFENLSMQMPIDTVDYLESNVDEIEMQDSKYPLLAVLRMDVDSLGMVFSKGLQKLKASPARVATLSRRLSLFFNGYINKLAKRHKIYITYSGGDDLFIIGSWINTINFAIQVRRDFRRFCCSNDNLSLSGGLLIVKPSYPVGRAAQKAGGMEENAKDFVHKNGRLKDAICIWDYQLSWDRFENLLEYGHHLYRLYEKKELSSSFIYSIHGLSNKRFDPSGEEDLHWFDKSIYLVKYLIARKPYKITEDKVKKQSTETKIKILSRLISEPDLYREFSIPAMISLYNIRSKLVFNAID